MPVSPDTLAYFYKLSGPLQLVAYFYRILSTSMSVQHYHHPVNVIYSIPFFQWLNWIYVVNRSSGTKDIHFLF